MSTMLPGGRSTFNSMGPATAAAPATAGAASTAAPTADPNSASIVNAAAALGTVSTAAAPATTAASPFAASSNLNFTGLTGTTPTSSAALSSAADATAATTPATAQTAAPQYVGNAAWGWITSGPGANQADSEGHLPSWYGGATWQDVVDQQSLAGGGTDSHGHTQDYYNLISQAAEYAATGGAATHKYGVGQDQHEPSAGTPGTTTLPGGAVVYQ